MAFVIALSVLLVSLTVLTLLEIQILGSVPLLRVPECSKSKQQFLTNDKRNIHNRTHFSLDMEWTGRHLLQHYSPASSAQSRMTMRHKQRLSPPVTKRYCESTIGKQARLKYGRRAPSTRAPYSSSKSWWRAKTNRWNSAASESHSSAACPFKGLELKTTLSKLESPPKPTSFRLRGRSTYLALLTDSASSAARSARCRPHSTYPSGYRDRFSH